MDAGLVEFTAALVALRREHPVFRRRRFFAGRPIRRGDELRDIAWFAPSGEEMTERDWEADLGRCVTVFLNGDAITDHDSRGARVTDDSFLLCFNAHREDVAMTLPGNGYGEQWTVVLDTTTGEVGDGSRQHKGDEPIPVTARSLVVLERTG